MSNNSVHYNRNMDLELKRVYQKEYEKNHTREEFIKLIGKSYLEKILGGKENEKIFICEWRKIRDNW